MCVCVCENLSNDSLGPAVRPERYFPWALWNVEENSKIYAEGEGREKKTNYTLDFIFLLKLGIIERKSNSFIF